MGVGAIFIWTVLGCLFLALIIEIKERYLP